MSIEELPEKLFQLAKSANKQNNPQTTQPRMFGRYQIEKELGRGGMGVVYKAYDTRLKTIVALKIIISEQKEYIERFLLETSAIAKLNHPHIVRFYESGEVPKPHFTMEYIEGWTLSDLIKERKVDPLYLVDLMISLCEGLYYAHKNNIMHRDIKPSNIMIAKDGTPKIMDFGLAKLTDATKQLSKSGQMMGTVSYMAPEQIEGKATKESDIYSLGASIYEVLTYRTVFQGQIEVNIILQIMNDAPIPLRQLNPDISPYLEAICLKCLNKNPKKRYSDFKQLSRELKNFKNHRPIIARKYSSWDVFENFVQKNKAICASILLIFFIISVAFVVTFNALKDANEQRDIANEQRDIADEKTNVAENAEKKAKDALNETMKVIKYIYKNEKYKPLREDEKFAKLSEKILPKLEEYGELEDWTRIKAYMTLKSGDSRKSIGYYSELIQKYPNNAVVITNRGSLYRDQKRYREAEKDYNKAINLDPNYAFVYANRGYLYYLEKKYREAENDFNKAINLDPNGAIAYSSRGLLHYTKKRYKKAKKDYNKAIDLDPKFAEAYANRGLLYEMEKKYREAEKDYNKSINLDPDNVFAYNNRGNLYYRQGKYKEAEKDYNKVIVLNPKFVVVYISRGNLYRNQKRYKKAEKDYNKAINLDPDNASVYTDKGYSYYRQGKYKKAEESYNKAIGLDSNYVLIYYNRGLLYANQKKYQKAIQDWEYAILLGCPRQKLQPWINETKEMLNKPK